MELNQIEAFATIAQEEGFSRAATVLHLSQPAISRRISLLERELGATLFERVHGGAILTEAGETFLPYARRVLATVGDGMAVIRALSEREQGTIRLALVGTLASTDLTDRIKQFRSAYPDVKVMLQTARSVEVSALVQSGEVHFGLRYFEDTHQTVVSQLVEMEPLVVVCSSMRETADCGPPDVACLADLAWISYPTDRGSSGEPFTQLVERQLISAGLHDKELIAIDSLTAQKRLIEADFGFGLLPVSSIQEEVRLGTLRVLDMPILQTEIPVMIVHRKDGYLSKAANRFLEEMIA